MLERRPGGSLSSCGGVNGDPVLVSTPKWGCKTIRACTGAHVLVWLQTDQMVGTALLGAASGGLTPLSKSLPGHAKVVGRERWWGREHDKVVVSGRVFLLL